MKRTGFAVIALSVMLAAGISIEAHHSFAAAYDMSKQISVKGTLKSVRLTNPHSFFFVEVKNPTTGKTEEWSFEAGTPSGMLRNGYKSEELPAGTEVTITGYHARDMGQNAGMLNQIKTAAGKTYGMFGPQESGAAGR